MAAGRLTCEKPAFYAVGATVFAYEHGGFFRKDGKGKMFSGNPPDFKLEQLTRIFNELNGLFQDYLIIQAKELSKVQQKKDG